MSLALNDNRQDNSPLPGANGLRHDWTRDEVRALFALPFPDLSLIHI